MFEMNPIIDNYVFTLTNQKYIVHALAALNTAQGVIIRGEGSSGK